MSNEKKPVLHRFAVPVALALLALALTWWLRSPMHAMPLERDEGAYATIAVRWMAGDVLYRELFDHKPPLVYGVYALAQLVPASPVSAVRTLATLYLLASGVIVLLLGWRLYGAWGAVAGLVLFLAYASSRRFQGLTFNSEAIMTLPSMLGCLLVVWGMQLSPTTTTVAVERTGPPAHPSPSNPLRRCVILLVLAGVCVGLAILAKPVGGVLLLPLALAPLLLPWPWVRRVGVAGLALAAAAVPLVGCLIYLGLQGALPAMHEALISYNRIYMQESMRNLARDPFWIWNIWKPMLVLFGPGIGGGAATLWVRSWRTPAHIIMGVWGLSLLGTALISVRDYPHYYLAAVPAFSVWSGALVAGSVRALRRWGGARLPRLLAGVPGVVLVAVLVVPPVQEIWPLRSMSPREQIDTLYGYEGTEHFWAATQVAEYLASRVEHNEQKAVFLWISEPQIYYLANLPPPTRFVYDYPVDRLPGARDEVLRTLRQVQPSFIVTYRDVRPIGFYPFANEEGYQLAVTIGGFDVFKRHMVQTLTES
jgi:4-amino-4-deoxy-L-arabinose transferase-like glycosyltransferase